MQRTSLPQQPIMPSAHSTAADTGAYGCPMPDLSLRTTVAKRDRPPGLEQQRCSYAGWASKGPMHRI